MKRTQKASPSREELLHWVVPANPPTEPVEYEPFKPGREVRTFRAAWYDQRMLGLVRTSTQSGLSHQVIALARLVLVDRFNFRDAARHAGKQPSAVNAATRAVMAALGYHGAAWYRTDPDKVVVFRDVPAKYHARLRELVEGQVKVWAAREASGEPWGGQA